MGLSIPRASRGPRDETRRERLREGGEPVDPGDERLALVAVEHTQDVARHVVRLDHETTEHAAPQGGSLRESLRLDETGIDRVDADPAWPQVGGRGARERERGVLRGGVRARRRERDGTGDRDDVDDVGVARSLERGQERAQAPDGAEVVDADEPLEAVGVDRREARAARYAGVVDEEVDPGVPRANALRRLLDRAPLADVAALELTAQLAGERAEPFFAARDEHAEPVASCERTGDRLADPAGSAGDDRDASQRQMRTGRVAARRLPLASVATARRTCLPFVAPRIRHAAENRPLVPLRATAIRFPSAKNATEAMRLFDPATTSSGADVPATHWPARGASHVTAGPGTTRSVTVLKTVFGIRLLPIVSRFFASWKSDAVSRRLVFPENSAGAALGS